MRILTILLIIYLTALPLSGQSRDRIEMSRDVEYYRNTRPDTPLPDVYMPVDYPELTDSSLSTPHPLIKRELLQKKVPRDYVIRDPFKLMLPVPGVSRQMPDQRLSDLFITCSARTGIFASLEQNLDTISSEIFVNAYSDRLDKDLRTSRWISGGCHYQDRSDIKAGAAFRNGENNSLYGFGSFNDSYSSPVFQCIPDLYCVLRYGQEGVEELRTNIRSDIIFTDSLWSPRVELEGGSYYRDNFPNGNFRIRGGAGVSRQGMFKGDLEWRSDAALFLTYEEEDLALMLSGEGNLIFVTPGENSFFLSIKRDDPDWESRLYTGLYEDDPDGLFQFSSCQDGGAGLFLKKNSWDCYLKGGARWGELLKQTDSDYRTEYDFIPYGDIQFCYKKESLPVTDISFHAEHLSKNDLKYRGEILWYFRESRWSTGFRFGHYNPSEADLTALVVNEKFLYGLSTTWKGLDSIQLTLFTDYCPDEQLLDGGVSLWLSY